MILWIACALLSLITVVWMTRPLWQRDAQRRPLSATALAIAVLVPALSLGAYLAQGSWRSPQGEAQPPAQADQARMIEEMVGRLAARLKDNPDDAEGWAKLGRSYTVLERYSESAEAYAKANGLTQGANVDWLLAEAEALALSDRERRLDGRPGVLLAQALKQAPDNPQALWLSGLAAAQRGDTALAERHWQRLLKNPELPEGFREDLLQRLDELKKTKNAKPS